MLQKIEQSYRISALLAVLFEVGGTNISWHINVNYVKIFCTHKVWR